MFLFECSEAVESKLVKLYSDTFSPYVECSLADAAYSTVWQ